jgi:hypothetical protein
MGTGKRVQSSPRGTARLIRRGAFEACGTEIRKLASEQHCQSNFALESLANLRVDLRHWLEIHLAA